MSAGRSHANINRNPTTRPTGKMINEEKHGQPMPGDCKITRACSIGILCDGQ